MLLAGSAVAVYLLAGQRPAAKHDSRLSGRVASVQTVGLATPGPTRQAGSAAAPALLLVSPPGLTFNTAKPTDLPADYPEWTADQMVGGSYVFIYISTGRCLASTAAAAATLQRCDLSERQRWTRVYQSTDASGQNYFQLRNAADGRCLTVSGPDEAAGSGGAGAQLQRCGSGASWRQLIAFWSAY